MEKTEALISWLSGQSLLSTGVKGPPGSEAHKWAPAEIENKTWQTGSGAFCWPWDDFYLLPASPRRQWRILVLTEPAASHLSDLGDISWALLPLLLFKATFRSPGLPGTLKSPYTLGECAAKMTNVPPIAAPASPVYTLKVCIAFYAF